MTVKHYFDQSTLLQERWAQQKIACMLLEREAESIGSPGFDEHFGGSEKQAPYVHAVEKLQQAEAKLKAIEARQAELHAQMEEVIGQVERPDWQALLRCRFILGYNLLQCSDAMHLSYSAVQKYQRMAMKQIRLPADALDLRLKSGTACPG